jgi:S-DNA-T family DNA segregation ATPase FtsK/SpoIIIE
MEERYRWLLEAGKRKVERGDGFPLHVIVIDELAFYVDVERRLSKASDEFEALLTDLVRRGRAAGIIVVAATQKPSGDVVDTSLRDLFGFRWALRCSTWQASDTILGSGWASEGWSASSIAPADKGVGFLLHEEGEPTRLKAFYLCDDDLRALAARAEELCRPAVEPTPLHPVEDEEDDGEAAEGGQR